LRFISRYVYVLLYYWLHCAYTSDPSLFVFFDQIVHQAFYTVVHGALNLFVAVLQPLVQRSLTVRAAIQGLSGLWIGPIVKDLTANISGLR
jgi:hypothetical protein